jgi:hypothetical protein
MYNKSGFLAKLQWNQTSSSCKTVSALSADEIKNGSVQVCTLIPCTSCTPLSVCLFVYSLLFVFPPRGFRESPHCKSCGQLIRYPLPQFFLDRVHCEPWNCNHARGTNRNLTGGFVAHCWKFMLRSFKLKFNILKRLLVVSYVLIIMIYSLI